jgi:hypothetical protein
MNLNSTATKLGFIEMVPKILMTVFSKMAFAIFIEFQLFIETVSLIEITLVTSSGK